jgi:hypothetical protein
MLKVMDERKVDRGRPTTAEQHVRPFMITRRYSASAREPGPCDPSYETLAADAGCGERTVWRAMATMRKLGPLAIGRRGWSKPIGDASLLT